jgi:FixJ family two-component response regulator
VALTVAPRPHFWYLPPPPEPALLPILVVDDDPGILNAFTKMLRLSGLNVLTAKTGMEAIALAQQEAFALCLCDLRLPDMTGTMVMELVRRQGIDLPFVIVTGHGSVPSAVEALTKGAVDFIEKPVHVEVLIAAVDRALASRHLPSGAPSLATAPPAQSHAAARWARAVLTVIEASRDPKTQEGWSACAGSSLGTLRNWCRTEGLSARRSLIFARLLRGVIRQISDRLGPEEVLDVVDKRTLTKLIVLAGGSVGPPLALPTDVETFLQRQTLIKSDHVLQELRRQMLHRA